MAKSRFSIWQPYYPWKGFDNIFDKWKEKSMINGTISTSQLSISLFSAVTYSLPLRMVSTYLNWDVMLKDRLKMTLRTFYGHHHELVDPFNMSLFKLTRDTLTTCGLSLRRLIFQLPNVTYSRLRLFCLVWTRIGPFQLMSAKGGGWSFLRCVTFIHLRGCNSGSLQRSKQLHLRGYKNAYFRS